MPVRNACVARGIASVTGQNYLYTVPANNVLLLKSIYLFENNGLTSTIIGQLISSDLSVNVQLGTFTSPTPRNFSWSGWTVLNGGDSIGAYITASAWQYWIAGAVLPYATP